MSFPVYEFGDFRLDCSAFELLRDGHPVRVERKPLELLILLASRAGQLVARAEIAGRLWSSEVFVDTEHGINTAIRKVRHLLRDEPENPQFIQTVTGLGYRFIAPVTTIEAPAQLVIPAATAQPDPGLLQHHRMWVKIAAGILAISAIVVATFLANRRQTPLPQGQAVLTAVPFTALPGREISPVFSPDGSRIAFAWNGDPASGANGFDLYIKAIGSETLLRLTQHPSEWISAEWSPDGTQIVFHRLAGGDTALYIVPALGGPERKLRSTGIPQGWTTATNVSWSSDGKWIAFTDVGPDDDHGRIYLYSTETSEFRKLESPPGCPSNVTPAFSHRGDRLAYWCVRSIGEAALYSREVPEGKPQMIRAFRNYPNGLTWSADDTELIYSMGQSYSEMSEIELTHGSVKSLPFALSAEYPTVSPKSNQLAFSANAATIKIWRKDLQHPESPAVEVAPSSRQQCCASYSPDGSRIVFASYRGGPAGVWVGNEDGSNLVEISNPAYESGSPQWSPDGTKIAFDARPRDTWEVQIADVTERIPRKLITNLTNIYRPHWSRDGQWLYFHSAQAGKEGLYRCAASGGDAVLVSGDIDANVAQESFDGASLYFVGSVGRGEMKKIALSKSGLGAQSKVDGFPKVSGSWTVSSKGIYFIPADAFRSVCFYEFSTKKVSPVFTVQNDFDDALSVSHDGRWILYSQATEVNNDIMLVDHFR